MIGILVATHASLGKELIAASELVFGAEEQVASTGLYHGDAIEELEGTIKDAIEGLDAGDGVLVLVDLLGGSPSNMTAKAIYSLRDEMDVECIAGANLPLLIEALVARKSMGLAQLKAQLVEAGAASIVDLRTTLGL